jgi:hypothetical protein
MTAFGGIFRGPHIEGIEEGDENGQGARLVSLDLESGVVFRKARATEPASEPEEPPVEE